MYCVTSAKSIFSAHHRYSRSLAVTHIDSREDHSLTTTDSQNVSEGAIRCHSNSVV